MLLENLVPYGRSFHLLILSSAMRSGWERLFVACVHSLGVSVDMVSM